MSSYDARDKYGNEHLPVLGLACSGALFRLPSSTHPPSSPPVLHLGSPHPHHARATARKRTVARPVTASYEREKVQPTPHRALAPAPEVEPLDPALTTDHALLRRPGNPLFGSIALNESLKSAWFLRPRCGFVTRDGVLTLFFPRVQATKRSSARFRRATSRHLRGTR